MHLEPIVRKIFDNGLVLVSERASWSERVIVNIGIKVGSAYELPDEEGAAHFLEHLMWKRETVKETKKRGLLQDSHGISSNASTSYDTTNFLISSPKDKLNIALSTALGDLQNYSFDKKDFENERNVVLTELKGILEDNNIFCYQRIKEKILKGTPLVRDIGGRYDKVADLSQKTIIDFKKKWYVPNNIIVAVVGNFNQADLDSSISDTLGSLPLSREASDISIALDSFETEKCTFNRKGLELTHLHLGFQPVRVNQRLSEYCDLVDNILSSGENAILYQDFREKEGLVYSVGTEVINAFEDIVYFYFTLKCENHHAERAEDKLRKILDIMKKGGFSKRRFTDAKTLWKASAEKSIFERLGEKANRLILSEMCRDVEDYRELSQRINAMTYEQTQEYARELFSKPYVMVKLVPE